MASIRHKASFQPLNVLLVPWFIISTTDISYNDMHSTLITTWPLSSRIALFSKIAPAI